MAPDPRARASPAAKAAAATALRSESISWIAACMMSMRLVETRRSCARSTTNRALRGHMRGLEPAVLVTSAPSPAGGRSPSVAGLGAGSEDPGDAVRWRDAATTVGEASADESAASRRLAGATAARLAPAGGQSSRANSASTSVLASPCGSTSSARSRSSCPGRMVNSCAPAPSADDSPSAPRTAPNACPEPGDASFCHAAPSEAPPRAAALEGATSASSAVSMRGVTFAAT